LVGKLISVFQICIATGEIYGGEHRHAQLRFVYPRIVSFHWIIFFPTNFLFIFLDIQMVQNNTNGLLWIMENFPCTFCHWLKFGLALKPVGHI